MVHICQRSVVQSAGWQKQLRPVKIEQYFKKLNSYGKFIDLCGGAGVRWGITKDEGASNQPSFVELKGLQMLEISTGVKCDFLKLNAKSYLNNLHIDEIPCPGLGGGMLLSWLITERWYNEGENWSFRSYNRWYFNHFYIVPSIFGYVFLSPGWGLGFELAQYVPLTGGRYTNFVEFKIGLVVAR